MYVHYSKTERGGALLDSISYWYLIAILFIMAIFAVRLKKTSVPNAQCGTLLLKISPSFAFWLIIVIDFLMIAGNIIFIIIQVNHQSPEQGAVIHQIFFNIVLILMFLFNFTLMIRKNKLCENGIVGEYGLIRWEKVISYTRISDARVKFTFQAERISMNWDFTLYHSKQQKEEIDQILEHYIAEKRK